MRRMLFGAAMLAALGLLLPVNVCWSQDQLLPSKGFGSLSGKVVIDGPVPAVPDLTGVMAKHADKVCCLAGKDKEKVDRTWVVDPISKGVANVVVWVKPPKGSYFPIPANLKVRKEQVVIDQPHCTFIPRISAYNPTYYDGAKQVPTGQTLLVKNSADVQHNVRALGYPGINDGFNKNLPPKTEITVTFKPQPLPVSLNCDIHPWMAGKLFVFDHPYYAITKADGSYEIPSVPAGTEIVLMAWHEGKGYVTANGKKGEAITIQEGKNTRDFKVKAAE